jgi:hypothetical protein
VTLEQLTKRHHHLTQLGYPRITIPRDAIIDGQDSTTGFTYHYGREERLQAQYQCAAKPKAKGFRGWIRTNRGLAITLLDVLILIILVLMIRTVVMPNFSVFHTPEHPYRLELKATRINDQALGTLLLLPRTAEYVPPLSGGWFGFFVTQGQNQPTRKEVQEILASHHEIEDFLTIFGSRFQQFLLGQETFFDLLPAYPDDLELSVPIQLSNRIKADEPLRVWAISIIPDQSPGILTFQLGID